MNNVLVAFELMQYLDHKRDGKDSFMAVKLNISKAYDRMKRGFIEKVVEYMRFHEKWISLIMHCISTVSYFVIVNRVAYGCIYPTKSLYQGDPLSSYLFILYADEFSSLINDATVNQWLNGIFHL